MRKRRSPSASGTSLRIAIANENGTHDDRQRPHGGGDRHRPVAEREREVRVDAEVDHHRADAGDAQRRGEREALEPQRRGRVGGADRQSGEHGDGLLRALGDRQHDGERGGRADHGARVLVGHLPRRQRQERLVDAVDVDVLDLVDADDVDVDREARDERPPEIPEAAADGQPGDGGGRDQVQRDDADRRADDRVRAREAPQRPERADRGEGDGAAGHRRRRSDRIAPTGTNTRPASEPSTKRPAKVRRRRQSIGALTSSTASGSASGDGPAAGLRPLTATA